MYPLKTEGAPLSLGVLLQYPLSFLSCSVCSDHTEGSIFATTCISPGLCPDSVRVCSVHLRAGASSAKPRLIYHLQNDVHPKQYTTSKLK